MTFMRWFDLVFPLALLASPLCFLLLSPRGTAGAFDGDTTNARDRARGLTLVLLTATIICLGGHLWLWAAQVPFNRFTFCFFFPLWFGLAMPALAARNPDLGRAHPGGTPVRRASLTPRTTEPLAPRWLWALSIAIAAVCLLGIAIRPWGEAFGALPFDSAVQAVWLRSLVIQVAYLALTLPVLYGCIGMLRREPEPMDARASAELIESYASLRRFKAAASVWLFGVGGTALCGGTMLAMTWLPPDGGTTVLVLAIGGGVAGSALGIAGGIFGTIASMRRARINALIRTLDAR